MAERLLVTYPEDHPAFAGHFPGAPVVPGVLLVDELVLAISTDLHLPYEALQIRAVKFLSPVRPGEAVHWASAEAAEGHIHFTLAVGLRPVAAGTLWVSQAI